MSRWLTKSRLKIALLLVFVVVLSLLARPAIHLTKTAIADKPEAAPAAAGHVDDASRMNETAVHEILTLNGDE
ncbi:MAG: hypothetical protein AAF585_22250, partial [Verrucomicrobiota bacterium]